MRTGILTLQQDCKSALRQLRHSLGTTLLAVLTLGVGMGVATAVFSVVYAVVLHPLPFPDAGRLMSLWSTRQGIDDMVTPRNFDAWRRSNREFAELGALQPATFTLSNAGRASQIPGGFATAGFFRVFGVSPEVGRVFSATEDRPPRLHIVVLSHRIWREHFAGDRNVVGQQIRLNREAFTVIGVMPSSFSVRPGSEEVWVPLALSGQEMNWTGGILNVVGRLKAAATRTGAQAEMDVLAERLRVLYPDMNRDRGIRVGDYASDLTGDYKGRLLTLLCAVTLVLLIGCANVANLLLARGTGRSQELAVRAALGASRRRVMSQLMTESLLLGLLGTLLGLGLAEVLLLLVPQLGFEQIPRLGQAGINAPVFVFALGLALLSTLLSGWLPALRGGQVDLQTVLRRGSRGVSGSVRDSARSAYIAGEVALAMVLLVSVGLLIRTAMAAAAVRPAFAPQHLVSGRTALPFSIYSNAEQVTEAYDRILQNLREQPGVLSAALASKVPLTVSTVGLNLKAGSAGDRPKNDFAVEMHVISEGYLATMRIPLLSGREFTIHDRRESSPVVLVNQSAARQLWPAGHAVGQTLRIPELEGSGPAWQVAGVVADVRDNGALREAPAVLYVPFRQLSSNPWHWIEQSLYLIARSQYGDSSTSDLLERPLSKVDRELPLSDVSTMTQRLERSVVIARFYTLVLGLLGAGGLLLTMAGIYGVVSYFVGLQRPEIGVRLALGSSTFAVLLLVIRQGMRPVLAGVMIGGFLSLGVTRLMTSQLYRVNALDLLTVFCAIVVLLLTAGFACYLPARQAAQTDPVVALRAG